MRNVSILILGILTTAICLAQDTPPKPRGRTCGNEGAFGIGSVISVYQVDLVIDRETLEKNERFQLLLKQNNIEDDEGKEALISAIRTEALQSLKLELIHCSASWWESDNKLRASLTRENVEEVENCFPAGKWIKATTTVVPNTIPDNTAWAEKLNQTLAERKPGTAPPTEDNYLGMTYKEAVSEVLKENKKNGTSIMCRLKSVDDFDLPNPYGPDDTVIIFEVHGGRVVKAVLQTRKL